MSVYRTMDMKPYTNAELRKMRRLHDEEQEQMEDREFKLKALSRIIFGVLIVVTIVAGQGVWRDHIAVQLTKEKAVVARAEADKAKEEAAKAMWEHYVPVDHQPPSAKQ